ncbi:hypothetical protein Tco_1440474 [Tanacetum coccineum]
MLQRCEDTNLVLNWEKCTFESRKASPGHTISKFRDEVDNAKVDVNCKNCSSHYLLKGIRSFLGAENLAADHLSRLENPHQSELEKKEITKTFPLETLGDMVFFVVMILRHTVVFADFANSHAGEFCDQRNVLAQRA